MVEKGLFRSTLLYGLIMVFFSCQPDKDQLFKLKKPFSTGIHFSNDLQETNEMNIIIYQDFYSGGGVSIGDINNDGLPDIFFTGNTVPSRLYKNEGNWNFKDITKEAGLLDMGPGWYTGTTMVDINNDGYLDIYVCKSGMHEPEDRKNLLFINQGDGTFVERAADYRIDHPGYAVNATFFDYDKDGDLDMFLVNQGPEKFESEQVSQIRYKPHQFAGDKLYENIGDRFIDVTEEAGIISSMVGFGHGVSVGDINNDGWEDIFVSNDFFEHDYLYLNNGDKTFTEVLKSSFKHTSKFSMGNDLADFNNDGLLDFIVLDMIAEGNRRLKENLGGSNRHVFNYMVSRGYHYQYMFNTLQMNNGNMSFSEIGTMAGISYTDWSWGPLFADFDNDGLKDLFVANGIRKDIRNIDWAQKYFELMKLTSGRLKFKDSEWEYLLSSMPSEPVMNYMFHNEGDLTFNTVMKDWGLDQPSFSNGAAYGDLDNDGDLDLVVNNIDQKAFVYENRSDELDNYNFIKIKFKGPENNVNALGTKVSLYADGNHQYQQFYLTRGYRSSMEPVLFFGLGESARIDSLIVTWPDGKIIKKFDLKVNQLLVLDHKSAEEGNNDRKRKRIPEFTDVSDSLGIDYRHVENEFIDYNREPLLLHQMSTLGPSIAVGDVNGDGRDDFYIGGAFRHPGHLYIQQPDGTFQDSNPGFWMEERHFEDVDAVFFDADLDDDMDLYVVSGGNELEEGSPVLQDRLYINDGRGNFTRGKELLPEFTVSGGVVKPADYDQDGDLDLFVGSRQVPNNYPMSPDSYLLKNEGGRFINVTEEVMPDLLNLGMVTSAEWVDIDRDQDLDLVIVGEWMPVTILINTDGVFKRMDNAGNGLGFSNGFWWKIIAYDIDKDGDMDLIAGNTGLNYRFKASEKEPFTLYSSDFNDDGKRDLVLGHYNDKIEYPVRYISEIEIGIPEVKEKYPSYDAYAVATLEDVYGKEALEKADQFKAYTFTSSLIENKGDGTFRIKPFENRLQISNINSILISDLNGDNTDDLLMAGNFYGPEVQTIRLDAGVGIYMRGDSSGNFTFIPPYESGLYIEGDVRDVQKINSSRGEFLLIAKNNALLQIIRLNKKQ